MVRDFDEDFLFEARRLVGSSDLALMSLFMGSNENAEENYKMAMNIRLKDVLHSLNGNMRSLKKSMTISSWVMGIMTFLILVLTGVLVWRGLGG